MYYFHIELFYRYNFNSLKKIAINLLEHNNNSWFKEHLINPEIYII